MKIPLKIVKTLLSITKSIRLMMNLITKVIILIIKFNEACLPVVIYRI